nr:Uncharacterised protein [Raoultella sp. NCTC 9187]
MVEPVYSLVINMKPFAAQQLPDAAVTKTPALQRQFGDAPG